MSRTPEHQRAVDLANTLATIIQDLNAAMQAAVIEWEHGKGAEAAMGWIENTLDGPGLLPDPDAPHGRNAQFWFDTHRADPMPLCPCGNPSHILSKEGGFCCKEHFQAARERVTNGDKPT